MRSFIKALPGIGLSVAVAVVATLLEKLLEGLLHTHIIGGAVIAMFIGMLLNHLLRKTGVFAAGAKFTSKKILKFAIILLGLSLNIKTILDVGQKSLIVMVFTLLTCFGGGYFIGKALGLNWKLSNLISAGTGICGGSAIAAIAPTIEAEDNDVAYAMSATFLFDMAMIVLFPIMGRAMGMTAEAFGIWAGGRFELPTIDMKWGIETTAEDGTVQKLVDQETLETVTVEGLRSVKCYGSSMAFKAKLQKIPGIHGVRVFVKRHAADILYDPAKTDPDKIQEAIYVPSKFRVQTPDPAATDSLKILTIRTEGMFDKMDINYLGMQMRLTGKKIYGLETEFACPLIVRVYADPSEDLDEDWFEEIVEKDVLSMPVHGGGTKDIELNYKFEDFEGETGRISTEQFIRNMFSPFRVQWKSRIEAAEGKQQYVYEIVDKNYEKPIILRNMPFLSNHLSRHEGVIGVYLDLNKDLQPAIQIRYADPMTEDKLWELMTMDTWTITYKADDVREEGAKLSFKTPGTSYEYNM